MPMMFVQANADFCVQAETAMAVARTAPLAIEIVVFLRASRRMRGSFRGFGFERST
jgi:hypothetical protein